VTRETVEAKAVRLLAAGRLTVLFADARRARAVCEGDSGRYDLGLDRGQWWCECPSARACSHLLALQRVTVQPRKPDA